MASSPSPLEMGGRRRPATASTAGEGVSLTTFPPPPLVTMVVSPTPTEAAASPPPPPLPLPPQSTLQPPLPSLPEAGASRSNQSSMGPTCAPPPTDDMGPLTFKEWLTRARNVLSGGKTTMQEPTGGVSARKDFGWLILGGSILCFIAGWVNAFTIIAAQATVSHVTGSTTKAGMSLVTGDGAYLTYAFGLWACFVLGGAMAGIIILKDTFAMGRGYGHAFLLISGLLLWASIWVLHDPDNHGYLFLCAMGMGIQNGITTRYSGNVVRTTHMTGLSTDIGITIGHVLRCHPKPDRWKLKMYIPMLISFFLGAAASRAAYISCGRASLLFPTFFLCLMGLSYIYYLSRTRHQPFHKVLLKRISQEVLVPDSPTNLRKRLQHMHMPHLFGGHHHHHHTNNQHGPHQDSLEPDNLHASVSHAGIV